jgi:hypothetical protein
VRLTAPENILFSLESALSLLSSQYDLPAIRKQLVSSGECEFTSSSGDEYVWVIWPGQWSVCLSTPSVAQIRLIQMLGNQKTWGEWLERVPMETLQQAIAHKWIVGSHIKQGIT